MPLPPIRTNIPQPLNILSHLPLQIVLNLHPTQFSIEVENLFCRQIA